MQASNQALLIEMVLKGQGIYMINFETLRKNGFLQNAGVYAKTTMKHSWSNECKN
jgi:hypothetical protein